MLSHYPANFVVHRPDRTGNDGVCNISFNSSSISSSNSNVEVPMPRFTNGLVKTKYEFLAKKLFQQ